MDTIKHNTRLQTRIALSTSKDNNHDQVVVNADSSTKKLKDRLSIASYGTIKPNYATTNCRYK
jgi:pyoverdine/dityrosine biosynthesis protein Dit1